MTVKQRFREAFADNEAGARTMGDTAGIVAGAVMGGMMGAMMEKYSLAAGLATSLAGVITRMPMMAGMGAGMVASTTGARASNLRTSPTGKFDMATEQHNMKEKAKAYMDAFTAKFPFNLIKKKGAGTTATEGETVGFVAEAELAALDRIGLDLISSGEQFTRHRITAPTSEPIPTPSITSRRVPISDI